MVDFLLNLANNPTGANEIENPIKKNVMDFSSDDDTSSEKSYKSIPQFDWSVIDPGKDDPDDLSTWTLTSDENNESADEMHDLEDTGLQNTGLPLVPKIEISEPKRETLEEVFGPIKRELDLFSEYTDCYGDNPAPWVQEDTKSGFSIICKIPNNLTHDIIQKKKTLANGGIPDRGWKIYHERTVLRHLMFYGLGCFGPSKPGILFEWDETKDEFVSRQKIGLTWLAPGSLPIKIKSGIYTLAGHMTRWSWAVNVSRFVLEVHLVVGLIYHGNRLDACDNDNDFTTLNLSNTSPTFFCSNN